MNNKLSLTFILTSLLLVIWLAGCGEEREDICILVCQHFI